MREIWCFTIFSYLRLYSLSLSLPTLSNMFLFLQGDASSVGHGAVLNIVQEEEEASGCVLVKMHEGSRVEIFSFFTGVPHNCQWNPTFYSISSSITLCGWDCLQALYFLRCVFQQLSFGTLGNEVTCMLSLWSIIQLFATRILTICLGWLTPRWGP